MGVTIGRIALDDPESWAEPVGESLARVGATPVPGARSGHSVSAGLTSFPAASAGSVADRRRVRRQLRSLLNNLAGRLAGVYVAWDEDDEQSGWYVPGGATFDVAGPGGLAAAFWRFAGVELALVGRPRTHRRAVIARHLDRRLSTTPRDTRGLVYSTDFAALATLSLTWLPSGATDVTVEGARATVVARRATIDGGEVSAVLGAADLAVLAMEQAAGARTLGEVVVRDRRGVITPTGADPDPAWEEVYGPDWPCAAAADWRAGADVPLVENGVCRVRWDATGTPGLRLDRFVSGSGWIEQGKILLERRGDSTGFLASLVSAHLAEWSPENAVVEVVLARAADAFARDLLVLTLRRGWSGPRIELYPAPINAGTAAGAGVYLVAAQADAATAVVMPGASAVAVTSTAGTGSAALATVDHGSFGGQNWIAMTRDAADPAAVMAVVQSGASGRSFSDSGAYGAARNAFGVYRAAAGYVSAHLALAPIAADTQMEAESITLATGTASAADAAASGGNAATATRTAEADHVTRASWLSAAQGVHRVFARVRAPASATLSVRATTGATTGAVVTTTSTTYVWLDLGDITANGTQLAIRAWLSAGTGTFAVDRIEALRVEDRTATDPGYGGARDAGALALVDSRSLPSVVAR